MRRPARRLVALAAAATLLVLLSPAPGGADDGTTSTTAPPLNSTVPGSDAEVTVTTGLTYYPGGPTYDSYVPTGGGSRRPALIMVNGGGWQGGDQNELAPYAMQAAREQGWVAFTVDYRLDADDPSAWADELHDVQAAIRYLVGSQGPAHRIDPSKVLLLGDSAGANLVALVSAVGTTDPVTGTAVGYRPDLAVDIAAVALWSPPTDLAALTPTLPGQPPPGCGDDDACDFTWSGSATVDYIGCEPAACPPRYAEASPIGHVSASTAPSFVANSTDELVPLDQVQAYVAALQGAGVDVRLEVVDGDLHATQLGPQVWAPSVAFLSARVPGGTDGDHTPWALAGGVVAVVVVAAGVLVAVVEHRRHEQRRRDPGAPRPSGG